MTNFLIATAAVCAVTAAAFILFDRARRKYGDLLAQEKSYGHADVIRTLLGQIGRRSQPDQKVILRKATRMPRGWVFIVVSRRPGEGERQYVGWALTLRGAQRKLDRHLHLNRERGASALVGVALVAIGLFMLAAYAPDLLGKVFRADVVAWLRETGAHLWDGITTWLRGL